MKISSQSKKIQILKNCFISCIFTLLFCILFVFESYSSNDSTFYTNWQREHLKKIVFQENCGQLKYSNGTAATDILFKAELQGVDVFITQKGLSYIFTTSKTENHKLPISDNSNSVEFRYNRLDIDLKNAVIKKENIIKQEVSNFSYNFYYNHCRQGVNSVKEYGKLIIKEVYPGIDWVLYNSNEKGIKYDFIVQSGADPNQISLLYKSLNQSHIDNGNISLNLSFGNFIDSAPECFLQNLNTKIGSKFIIKNKTENTVLDNTFYETEIGFNVENYNKNETLIIDPLQQWWGTYYGGSKTSEGVSVTTDSLGNLFVLGNTESMDIPLQPYGSLAYFQGNITVGGAHGDLFILKFTNAGQLLWATYFGGTATDEGVDIKCDHNDNIFVLAETSSINLPLIDLGGGVYYDTTNGNSDWSQDIFIGKFSNTGAYLWGTYYGGDYNEYPKAISIDINNNVYCTGSTRSQDFPVFDHGGGAYFKGNISPSIQNQRDAFILKFSNSGQRLLATFFGGNGDDEGLSSDCDQFGNVYFGGQTASSNLYTINPGSGAFFTGTQPAPSSNYSGFILKLNSNCQAIWSTYIAGTTGICNSIVCDQTGNLFMSGSFGINFPTINPGGGAYFSAANPMTRLVIAKFNISSQMIWSTYFGTWGTDGWVDLAIGSCNEIYACFRAQSNCPSCPPIPIMNPENGAYCDSTFCDIVSGAQPDFFIAAFTNSGILKWGTYFGGAGIELSMFITCDKNGNLFYTGEQGIYYYTTPALLQTYISGCIKDPGNGAYFQGVPNAPLNSTAYCVIGKFTNPYPSPNILATGCNSNDTLIALPFQGWGPYDYNWSNGAITNSITGIPAGSYTCEITDSFLGCKQEEQIYFGVPSVSVIALNTNSVCLGQNTNLVADGADSYSWSPSNGLNLTSGNSVNSSPNSTAHYTITGTTSSNCSSNDTITVIVKSLPIINLSGNDSICEGNVTSINASGANNYIWSPNIGLNTSTGNNVNANPNQTQIYTIIGIDNNGCIDSTKFTLNIIPLPELQIVGSPSLCIGQSATLTATGADQYIWNYGTSTYSGSIAVFSPSVISTYTLLGINNGICKDSMLFPITVFQTPSISIQAPDTICQEEEFSLYATGDGSFLWFPYYDLSCSQCQVPLASIENTTKFLVTITDNNHCSKTDSITVIVDKICGDDIVIPNVFSPNSDGVNDFFKVHVTGIRSYQCEIYDRWGLKLFTSTTPDISWNGILSNGGVAPEGAYFYLIRIIKYNNQIKDFKGHLSLFR